MIFFCLPHLYLLHIQVVTKGCEKWKVLHCEQWASHEDRDQPVRQMETVKIDVSLNNVRSFLDELETHEPNQTQIWHRPYYSTRINQSEVCLRLVLVIFCSSSIVNSFQAFFVANGLQFGEHFFHMIFSSLKFKLSTHFTISAYFYRSALVCVEHFQQFSSFDQQCVVGPPFNWKQRSTLLGP